MLEQSLCYEQMIMHSMSDWSPPADWVAITTIDAHTGGEPFRVIIGGFPAVPGDTILERRRHAKEHLEHLRTALMLEPRGHADMYGCIVTPPVTPGADIGILFMHNAGYSTMCGHGIIAITKVVLETGVLPMQEPETAVRIDSPAGLVSAHARVSDGRVQSVYFHNVPSFALALDQTVAVPGLGQVRYDLAFGGAFYAYVEAQSVGLTCRPEEYQQIIRAGRDIKKAIMASREIPHPFESDLGFLYGTIFVAPALGEGNHSRNVCVFADGEVDRSPTGTGVSGRLAIHHARGELAIGQPIVIESIIGTCFTGRVADTTEFGPHQAIIPEIEGTAYLTGKNQLFIDPDDPLREGFMLR